MAHHRALPGAVLAGLAFVSMSEVRAAAAVDIDALVACRGLAAPDVRLACFDRVTAGLASVAEHAGAIPLSPQQKFGLSPVEISRVQTPAERAQELDVISAKVSSIQTAADGRLVVTLDSGQVWRQLVPGEDLMLQVGDPVSIVRGALGSFRMRSAQNRATKVTRVR